MYLVTKLLEASDMFITFASLRFLQVDLLGDEVDNLVGLLERVSTVLEHYSPVLQHYPGVVISQLSFCFLWIAAIVLISSLGFWVGNQESSVFFSELCTDGHQHNVNLLVACRLKRLQKQ
jgi:hypothetical protein